MSARPVEIRVRLTAKQAAVFKDMANAVGATPEDMLLACACADVAMSDPGEPEKRALEAFSAIRTFVREGKTPAYPADGLLIYDFATQEDDGQ